MRVAQTRRWTRRHTIRFEGIAEARAHIWPRAGARWDAARAAPYCGSVPCPRTGAVRSVDECTRCECFVNLRPDPDRQHATLRCLCCDDDPLARHVADPASWPRVAPDVSAASARQISWTHCASMLLVTRDDLVVGVVHAHALQDAEGRIDELMDREPWSLAPAATLGDAVEAMAELHLPAVLVVAPDDQLHAVVGTCDLRRMGVPGALLGR
jgi:hypothetical protein